MAEQHGVRLKLVKLKSAAEARQQLASPYGMINLDYNGQVLADHPISATRFRNILQKDLGLSLESQWRLHLLCKTAPKRGARKRLEFAPVGFDHAIQN